MVLTPDTFTAFVFYKWWVQCLIPGSSLGVLLLSTQYFSERKKEREREREGVGEREREQGGRTKKGKKKKKKKEKEKEKEKKSEEISYYHLRLSLSQTNWVRISGYGICAAVVNSILGGSNLQPGLRNTKPQPSAILHTCGCRLNAGSLN